MATLTTSIYREETTGAHTGYYAEYAYHGDPDDVDAASALADRLMAEEREGQPDCYEGLDQQDWYIDADEEPGDGYAHGELVRSGGLG